MTLFSIPLSVPQESLRLTEKRPLFSVLRPSVIRGVCLSALVLLSVPMVVSCSSSKKAAQLKPAPLVQISSPVSLKKEWTQKMGKSKGGDILLSPVVSDDVVYAASSVGQVWALDIDTGKPLWKQSFDDEISGGVAADDDHVWFSLRSGELVAISTSEGEEVWRVPLSSENVSPIFATSKHLLVQTIDGHLRCLDKATGKTIWDIATQLPKLTTRGTATPKALESGGRGLVFAGFANGKFIALDLQIGAIRWERQVGRSIGETTIKNLLDIDANFLIEDSTAYVSSKANQTMAIDLRSGRTEWVSDKNTLRQPVLTDEAFILADSAGVIWALDVVDGDVVWQQEALKGRRLSGVAIDDSGRLLVGDKEGYLHILKSADGTMVGRTRLSSSLIVAPVVVDDAVIVQSDDGRLSRLSF